MRLPPISLDDVPSLSPEAAVGAYVFEEESIHTGQGVPYPPGTPHNYSAQLFAAIPRNSLTLRPPTQATSSPR